MSRCDLHGRDCIANKSTLAFGCLTSCDGIYADINKWVDWDSVGSLEGTLYLILSEYEKFKQNAVKHLRFNPKAGFDMFGNKIIIQMIQSRF